MNPIQLMRVNETNMTKSEIKIMHYVINNLEDIKNSSMVDVAKKADTSRSALLRFSQKLGYDGYAELKFAISQYLATPIPQDESESQERTIASIYAETLSRLDATIDKDEIEKMSIFFNDSKKIKIIGYAETGLTATHFSQRLLDISYDAESISTISTLFGKIDVSSNDDVLVFFTLSGNTEIIKNAITHAHSLGRQIVLVSQNSLTPLRSLVDCFILLPFHDFEGHDYILDSQIILHGFIGIFINYLVQKKSNS